MVSSRSRKINKLITLRKGGLFILYVNLCGYHVLVAMRRILAWADGQDVELGPVGARLDWAHLSVVKHPVAFLCEERHVHREALRRPVTLVPQRLLRLHEVLHTQQRSR